VVFADPARLLDSGARAVLTAANLDVEREAGLFLSLIATLAGTALSVLLVARDLRAAKRLKVAGPSSEAPAPSASLPSESQADRASGSFAAASSAATSVAATAQRVAYEVESVLQPGRGIPTPPLPSSPRDILQNPAQVVIGRVGRQLPIFPAVMTLLTALVLGGGSFGAYYGYENLDLDTSSLPLIGSGKASILVALSAPCIDDKGQPCNLLWDVLVVKADDRAVRIEYEVRSSGQGACQLNVDSDRTVIQKLEAAGRFGPFLEGGRGRYYPLVSSEGFGNTGGSLPCGQSQKGAWIFRPAAGETVLKLRYPGLAPALIQLAPLSARLLPENDPYSVIPVQSTACQTAQNQPCRGAWEIGPYGLASDGSPIVFFAVRWEGPANCTLSWQADTTANRELIARGERGIRLVLAGGAGDLGFVGGGGLSVMDGPQPCGRIHTGFWRFAKGSLSPTVELAYPDLPNIQIPILP
jgi:hypothetical protein